MADSYRAQPSEMHLLMGTVAGQIGYSQGASGMASLIKLVLSFQHGKLPASFGGKGFRPSVTVIVPLSSITGRFRRGPGVWSPDREGRHL